MQVLAPAKINLSLKILGRRSDGFHEIETLIAPITLCDEIEISKSNSKQIEFHCDDPSVPTGDDNLIVRATKSFFAATKLNSAVLIEVKKKIPHGAGLGGGSSDAASTLLALNELFGAKLPREAVAKIAETIGSDVPFFIFQSPALCRGRGELVTRVKLKRETADLVIETCFCRLNSMGVLALATFAGNFGCSLRRRRNLSVESSPMISSAQSSRNLFFSHS